MNIALLESYLKQAQIASCQLDNEPNALQDLLHTIERSKDASESNAPLIEFFKGEYAFYNGQYERAIKHYLAAKGINNFEFFCFRASAFVSRGQGFYDKAINFAKKALEIFPDDFITLKLLAELYKRLSRDHEAQEIFQKTDEMTKHYAISKSDIKETHSHFMLGSKEKDELAGIFLPSENSDGLFTEEDYNHIQIPPEENRETFPSIHHLEQNERMVGLSCNVKDGDILSAMTSFQSLQDRLVSDYQTKWKERPSIPDNCLHILQGWHENTLISPKNSYQTFDDDTISFLTADSLKSTGGVYLRWKGKGIVINPGTHFLENFHRDGLHVRDIDYVIVTNREDEAFADLKKIYELSYRLNRASGAIGTIQYYLHQKAFQTLSSVVKLHYKHERHAIHQLELYADSHGAEKLNLGDGIQLYYFSHPSLKGICDHSACMGIRLELSEEDHLFSKGIKIGYISYVTSASFESKEFDDTDIMLAGISHLSFDHTSSINYEFMNQKGPSKLLLCTEFDGGLGDIRLEIIRRLREIKTHQSGFPVVLPADNGLFVDLKTFSVKCTYSNCFVDARDIRVVRSAGLFSHLNYLSSSSVM